jgi:hypothetical protein
VFPEPAAVPSYIWHDNNCQLLKILPKDDYLREACMPVDVFHFQCKHKVSDTFCQKECNPIHFPELTTNARWTFNSSAAEQANMWIGKFQSICREMRMERYNFFLDEMIRRKNEYSIRCLMEKKKNAVDLPLKALLPETLAKSNCK